MFIKKKNRRNESDNEKTKTGLQKYTYLYELYMWTRSGVDLGNIFDLDGIKRFDSQRNDKHTYAFKNKIHDQIAWSRISE